MYKVKIFYDVNYDSLENNMNEWFEENRGIKLVDIKYIINEKDEYNEFSAMIIYKE